MGKNKKASSTKRKKTLEEPIHTLLNRLHAEHIRYLFSKFGKKPETKKGLLKEDLIEQLLTSGTSLDKIEKEAHIVDSSLPPKHMFVCTYTGKTTIPGKKRDFIAPNTKKLSLVFHNTESDGDVETSLTFEHGFEIEYWSVTENNKRMKELKKEKITHPVYVKLYRKSPIALISYPGYESHGRRKSDYLSYSGIVSDVIGVLESDFGLTIKSIPIRSGIDALVDNKSSRVFRKEMSPVYENGKISFSVSKKSRDVESFFKDLISPYINKSALAELESGFSTALKKGALNGIVALWTQESLVTRIEFWEHGAEFLFIWGQSERHYAKCFNIFELIYTMSLDLESKDNVMSLILKSTPGEYLFPADLASQLSISAEELRSGLIKGVKAGLLVPAYKIKTSELIPEYDNEWTPTISTLAKPHTLESGEIIDGSDPKNIEIAFQRHSEKSGVK